MQDDLLDVLKKMISERQRSGGGQPVADFERDLRRFAGLDPAHCGYLYARRKEVLAVLGASRGRRELLDHAETGLQATIWRHNQFLSARDLQARRLRAHYTALLRDLQEALARSQSPQDLQARLRPVLTAHHSRLTRTSRRLVSGRFRPDMPEPPCSEYSADLQCRVLRLLDQPLLEPVLDIGCGQEASLVTWLNERGIEAYGIDRVALESERTWKEDWLVEEGRWRQRRWGTIVSHLAFANHFVHQHLRRDGEAEVYARRFMEILEHLRPRGSFVYAPAVPFIEDLLPDRYRVTRWKVGRTGLEAARIDRRH